MGNKMWENENECLDSCIIELQRALKQLAQYAHIKGECIGTKQMTGQGQNNPYFLHHFYGTTLSPTFGPHLTW